MLDATSYTVGWICALPIEFTAAKAFLDEMHKVSPHATQQDNNNYALGRIGSHNVAIAVLPNGEYGIASAAVVARDMLHSFPNVRIGLLVGVGGGAPSSKHDIRLGDIVVSSRNGGKGGVFQYDYGKAIQNQDASFQHTDFLNQPPMVLRTAVNALESQYEMEGHQLNVKIDRVLERWPRLRKRYSRPPSNSDRLYRFDVLHPDSSVDCDKSCSDDPTRLVSRSIRGELDDDPAIHYGLIASANQLMKNAIIRDKLAVEKGVLCFETEAAGLNNHFPCLVIRGICDYSDSHKNNRWQGFAAMMAAAYATDILRQIPPSKIEAEKRLGNVLNQLQEDLAHVNRNLNETKNAAITLRKEQNLNKLSCWLSPPDPSINAIMARTLRHPGTGAWFLESTVFKEWKTAKRQHLWLYGLAGCGKTVLTTTILDYLQQIGTYPLLTFFFDFNNTQKQTLEDLLRSLAFQLYHHGTEFTRKLDDLLMSHDVGQRQPDIGVLSACVESMIQASPKLTIVIDALDECSTRCKLLSWMKRLALNLGIGNTKLIITGRPEADFQNEIPRIFGEKNCILLDKKAVNADIRSYVAQELQQRPTFVDKEMSPDLLEQIRIEVGDRADGMFRWAACQLDSLAECLSPQAVKTALKQLPRDLNETYKHMLQDILPGLKIDAIRLLHFLVYAERPLTVYEAIDIIATQTETEPHSFNVARRLFRKTDILKYCPSLITITETLRSGVTIGEVHLTHFSVKEYLLSDSCFHATVSSIMITRTCLTYLTFVEDTPNRTRSNFPLARYAAQVWMSHARLAEASKDIAQKTEAFLQDKITFDRWTSLFQADTPWVENPGPSRASRLYYTCLAGLPRVSRNLLSKEANIDEVGGKYGNALQAASVKGYQDIVQLLLDNGADIEVEGGEYGYALHAASAKGHQAVVQLLLDEGADVNAGGDLYGTAVQDASTEGHIDIVRLLLDKGADVNANGGRYGNALHAASAEGHRDIVQLLLETGADIDSDGFYFDSALQAAVYQGHQEIVQLLIHHGADIIQLLLQAAAKAYLNDVYYKNLLQAGLNQGHREIVQLLIDHRADIDTKSVG